MVKSRYGCLVAWVVLFGGLLVNPSELAWAQANRFATSHSQTGYVHWIELYDAQNNRISPESTRPYSPLTTCGRCHDVETISHGFHFQAGSDNLREGRPGQPWVWSDPKTGTQLPLSYRGGPGTFHPDQLGITRWQMAAHFGGYLPGGGPGSESALAGGPGTSDSAEPIAGQVDRSHVTGPLPIDCMLCHHRQGSGYSPFAWTEQIEQENFAYAPVAALGVATVQGQTRRLKDDFDPRADGAAAQLPSVQYDPARFRPDGKVLFDLVRKPENNACYYCHSQTTAEAVQGQRWWHDEDVHIRAGMACVDCHRNGLDHETVRGFAGEKHPGGAAVGVLSCQGCHLGSDFDAGHGAVTLAEVAGPLAAGSHGEAGSHGQANSHGDTGPHGDAGPHGEAVHAAGGTAADALVSRSGKLGAPRPLHAGIPPLHFERMACTACHAGPLPDEPHSLLLSAVHGLGQHTQWTGSEAPWVGASVQLLRANVADEVAKYAPFRWLWPAYWGVRQADGSIVPLHPEQAAAWLRKPLKVRQDLAAEIGEVKLTLAQRRELLGEERAKVPEAERTADEVVQLQALEQELRERQINERIADGLTAIQAEVAGAAVYVSGGRVYELDEERKVVSRSAAEDLAGPAAPVFWPIGHNVRPATQSLGAKSCTECHRSDSPYFQEQLTAVAVVPGAEAAELSLPAPMAGDRQRFAAWNQLMTGRAQFKYFALAAVAAAAVGLLAAFLTGMRPFSGTPANAGPSTWAGRWHVLNASVFAFFVIAVAVLGVTSFGSLARGAAMLGWALLLHVTVAGAFLGLLAVVAWAWLPALARGRGGDRDGVASVWLVGSGWLMVAACVAAAVAIVPGMFPWLGTTDMLQAVALHRYAGGAAVLTTAGHVMVLCLERSRGVKKR